MLPQVATEPEDQQLWLFKPQRSIDVAKLNAQRRELIANTHAENTQKGYSADWRNFDDWCKAAGRRALPASSETLALYITDRLAQCKVTTLERRLTGIMHAHKVAGLGKPDTAECRAILAGAQRMRKEQPEAKAALSVPDLRRIARKLEQSPTNRAIRDRAMILFGFAAALRRSEIAAANLADATFATKGAVFHLRSSKTDQEGFGMTIGIFRGTHPSTDPVLLRRAIFAPNACNITAQNYVTWSETEKTENEGPAGVPAPRAELPRRDSNDRPPLHFKLALAVCDFRLQYPHFGVGIRPVKRLQYLPEALRQQFGHRSVPLFDDLPLRVIRIGLLHPLLFDHFLQRGKRCRLNLNCQTYDFCHSFSPLPVPAPDLPVPHRLTAAEPGRLHGRPGASKRCANRSQF